MNGASPRWHGQRSNFPWEEDALQYIKAKAPDAEPYRAWQSFTFTSTTGHLREVDLFIATPGGLFLVEIKSHPGQATNSGSTWRFTDNNITRTIENPLALANQKSKELKELLQHAAGKQTRIPWVQPVIFLSAENLVCVFDEFQRHHVYARDEIKSGLTGIWEDCLYRPPRSERDRVTPGFSKQLPKLLETVGIVRLHRLGKVGPYELEEKSYDSGPTWVDYLAHHTSLPDQPPRRVRVYLSEQHATDTERENVRRAARREYLALFGINHEGIVKAETYSDELITGPAVVFEHSERWQRLDHFMTGNANLEIETRLDMIRQLAEALDHAHRRHLFHRALAARCVYVDPNKGYPVLRIADWQVAARPVVGTTNFGTPGSLAKHVEKSAGAYLAPEFAVASTDADKLDMFGLGVLSYLILTGQPPAASRADLIQKLQADHALVPSTVGDSLTAAMDALIADATKVAVAERTDRVRDFLAQLDAIEEELTAPDPVVEVDPLEAVKGDTINDWTVQAILGKGSTSRALLVTKEGHDPRVFKVALNDQAARRLGREAEQLRLLNDSHVVRILDDAFPWGPAGKRRTIIGLEYLNRTVGEALRQVGSLTPHELERYGEDLFRALDFLDKRDVWHRDIKPDNLALRELPRKGRELVLFDFSLAGTPDTELEVGTPDYIDPDLQGPRRTRFDQAAELYAVAVTLHEMASRERPSWGDGLIPLAFLDKNEKARLSEDLFDEVIRDGLVRFFRTALQREASNRFHSLRDMANAWRDIFVGLDQVRPLTTPSTLDDDEDQSAEAARDSAAEAANLDTPLSAAGLSPHALSLAQRLGASTVADLIRIQPARITEMPGIGSKPRYELVRRSTQWRRRFPDGPFESAKRRVVPVLPAADPLGEPGLERLSVDELVRLLVPDSMGDIVRVFEPHPWAPRQETARATGMKEEEVSAHLSRLRSRWAKSVPALTKLREQVLDILSEHGRILEGDRLARALLASRGSLENDPATALRLASICVRAAVETEESLDSAKLASRRYGQCVVIALTGAGRNGQVPSAEDLFAYADLLGEQADGLAARDPLPGVNAVRITLREVPGADDTVRLSDTDLVQLAAAASVTAAASKRLELYPRDLSPERALRIVQAGSLLSNRGVPSDELIRRVEARFPDLAQPLVPGRIPALLRELGYQLEVGSGGLLYAKTATVRSFTGKRQPPSGTAVALGISDVELNWRRLNEARERGGFVAVKARTKYAERECAALAALATPVDVSAEFIHLLGAVVSERGKPRWETVLAADTPEAKPAAKVGLAELLGLVWPRLEERIRSAGDGVVLLHNATPLARYGGGPDLLSRLAGYARQAGSAPHGLWLLCPTEDPSGPARLDDVIVAVIPGDAEQIALHDGFGSQEQMAS
jgi:serine/threonine protein kinase